MCNAAVATVSISSCFLTDIRFLCITLRLNPCRQAQKWRKQNEEHFLIWVPLTVTVVSGRRPSTSLRSSWWGLRWWDVRSLELYDRNMQVWSQRWTPRCLVSYILEMTEAGCVCTSIKKQENLKKFLFIFSLRRLSIKEISRSTWASSVTLLLSV